MANGLAMPNRFIYVVPALIFVIVAGYLFWGLNPDRDPRAIPTVMIDKPAPVFDLAPIAGMAGPGLATADLKTGETTLVNFFASWCIPCRVEHRFLTELAERDGVRLVGINYKNHPDQARPWLKKLGNPYARIGADVSGRVAIDWGVYGVPETYIVDGAGRIRYRHLGPIDEDALNREIRPRIRALAQ